MAMPSQGVHSITCARECRICAGDAQPRDADGLIVLAQMYHPKADMLQEAKKTGLALATAAAAQRAKRAAARPPPARRTPASAPQVNFRLTTMCLLNRA